MIQRVYEQAINAKSLYRIIVATDHPDIHDHVKQFGGECFMTGIHHSSGTDRCFEVLTHYKEPVDYVINIQGDEPFIHPLQINLLSTVLDGKTEIATLIKKIDQEEQLINPNVVKVATSSSQTALYFSLSPIPHIRNKPVDEWLQAHTFYKHIGMYAYRTDVLKAITQLQQSGLEKAESLEQLRWLENGYKISIAETTLESIGIDTPDDLKKAMKSFDD